MKILRPERTDLFFQEYIDLVPGDDPIAALQAQQASTRERLSKVTESQGDSRYAPDKWSAKQVLGHMADGERIFQYRLLWLARGSDAPLPGFDQDPFVESAGFDSRTVGDLAAEFDSVRSASLTLLTGLTQGRPDLDWNRPATVSGNPMTLATIPWLLAGHERHHLAVLADRYAID